MNKVKVTDILKENIHQRFVRSINRLIKADDKSAFHLLNTESTIPNIIFDKVENKNPKTVLVIDDLTCEIAREFPDAEITLALTSYRVPDIVYNIVKTRIEKYFSDVKKDVKIVQLKEIYDMENKFDLIIANPPYNMGNTIISNCVDKAKECVVLMPFSKYKANELYKHVLSLEIVDPKAFKDATITTNLCVCKLIPNKIERTFEELELETFDQSYREFYELNAKMPNKLPYIHGKYITLTSKDQLDRTFYISVRVNVDGVHHAEAFDVAANKGMLSIDELNADANEKKKTATIPLSSIEFKTKKEADNIKTFWYNSTFLSDIIWGQQKTGGGCNAAIPNIDWSVDRDYEHLTYEELLQIMKDELKNQSK